MKRFAAFLLAVCCCMQLTACGNQPRPKKAVDPYSKQVLTERITGSEPVDSIPEHPSSEKTPSSSGTSEQDDSSSNAAPAQAAAPDSALPEGDWSLQLVNADHPLPEDFNVETVSIPGYDDRQFDARAADALIAMLNAAQKDGEPLYLVSSYRSVKRQTALFERKTNYYMQQGMDRTQAETEAAKLVARPGTSEHNLGLAADIVSADWYKTHDDLTAEFETTNAARWLREHAAEYGFILRYPAEKEAITGVAYEPWHYRYVGPTAARAITAQGLTLEEYLGA